MRLLSSSTGRLSGIPPWALVLGLIWIALVITAALIPQLSGNLGMMCWFRYITGIPCPTCGGSRAFLNLLDGRLLDAFLLNPLLMALEILFLLWLCARLVFARKLSLKLSPVERRAAWAIGGALFVLNWIYLIVYLH